MEKDLEDTIELRLNILERKIDIILEIISDNKKNCDKMNDHIEFVEKTYSTLRSPLEYMKNKLNFIQGRGDQENLPILEN